MQFICLTFLLSAVLSLEDILSFLKRVFGRRVTKSAGTDQKVSQALLIASFPLATLVYLHSPLSLNNRLLLLIVELLLISATAKLLSKLRSKLNFRETLGYMIHNAAGLLTPFGRHLPAGGADLPLISKLAFYSALPPLLGLILSWSVKTSGAHPLPNQEGLIVVLIGSLLIKITVSLLEKHFTLIDLKISGYFRFALALALAYVLILTK